MGKWPKKVGNWPLLKKKVGRECVKNVSKMCQKWAFLGHFGLFLAYFGCFLGKIGVAGHFAHFFLHFTREKKFLYFI